MLGTDIDLGPARGGEREELGQALRAGLEKLINLKANHDPLIPGEWASRRSAGRRPGAGA